MTLKEKCSQLYESFWKRCVEAAHEQLEAGGYVEIYKDIYVHPRTDRVKYLSQLTMDYMNDNIQGAELIAGYYLKYYQENALKKWQENTENIVLSEQDKKVTEILETIFKEENVKIRPTFAKLKHHIGHTITCVYYGDGNNPEDICLECEDCNCVLVSAETEDNCW